ncbi:MAG: LL-diaminopimelate aminotransferase [archaeon]
MVERNPRMGNLSAGYLFPEITRRKKEFLVKNPDAKLISLGIGDTTEPLPSFVDKGLVESASGLGTSTGYSGYGAEQGNAELRARIASVFYHGKVSADEVFVSDGAKCDIGRLQLMFGSDVSVAVQDPAYPVYVDGSVIMGQADGAGEDGQYGRLVYLPCTPENDFFPEKIPRTDLIYVCSPNNPTGAVATREQLARLVKIAKENKSIIIFDAAYSMFIQDADLPKSIYEIDGAADVAIEVSSFSKFIGFTGVRLGWTVVPNGLSFDDGTPVRKDWERIVTTVFNGASNIAQAGGLSALSPEGREEMDALVSHYMENARLIRSTLVGLGYSVYGGDNAPYLWVRIPGKTSWEAFASVLENAHVVTTPGSGFGPAGEGFLRFSAFGRRADVEEACSRLKKTLG